jgi:hypothetical protein
LAPLPLQFLRLSFHLLCNNNNNKQNTSTRVEEVEIRGKKNTSKQKKIEVRRRKWLLNRPTGTGTWETQPQNTDNSANRSRGSHFLCESAMTSFWLVFLALFFYYFES